MTTVKELKDLGVIYCKGDDAGGCVMTNDGAKALNKRSDWDSYKVISFAWRPLSTLPDNPKFKYELNTKTLATWCPLLDQSSTETPEEKEAFDKMKPYEFDDHVSVVNASYEKISNGTASFVSNESANEMVDRKIKSLKTSKPVFTQAMADVGELPPVGSAFLYCNLANPKESDWREVESKYIDDDCMFFKGVNGVKGFASKTDMFGTFFKPIDNRTPKQKAVDAAARLIVGLLPICATVAGSKIQADTVDIAVSRLYDLWNK